jgi:phage portal protein BeeE
MPIDNNLPPFLRDELKRIEEEARENLRELAEERLRLTHNFDDAAMDSIRKQLS